MRNALKVRDREQECKSQEQHEVQEMIDDIASLLLMLYNAYFTRKSTFPDGGIEMQELMSILSFLYDSGLLCNKCLSLIEAERIRVQVMNSEDDDEDDVERGEFLEVDGKGSRCMDSGRFYRLLQEVANLVYEDTGGMNGKMSLHKLLTRHIYPASLSIKGRRHKRLNIFRLITVETLKCLLRFEDLLRIWYCTLTLRIDFSRHSLVWVMWGKIADEHLAVSSENLYTELYNMLKDSSNGSMCTENIVKNIEYGINAINQSLHEEYKGDDTTITARDEKAVKKYSFSDFLLVIQCLIVGPATSSTSSASIQRLSYELILQFATSLFNTHINNFARQQNRFIQIPSKGVQNMELNSTYTLKCQSLLWLLRQSRLMSLFPDLGLVIEILKKELSTSLLLTDTEIYLNDLTRILCRIFSELPSLKCKTDREYSQDIVDLLSLGVSREHISILQISLFFPSICLVDPKPIPVLFDALYDPFFYKDLSKLFSNFENIFRKCVSVYCQLSPSTELSSELHKQDAFDFAQDSKAIVNLQAFKIMCLKYGFVPTFVSQAVIMEAYDYIFDKSCVAKLELDRSDLIELIFVISQINSSKYSTLRDIKDDPNYICDFSKFEETTIRLDSNINNRSCCAEIFEKDVKINVMSNVLFNDVKNTAMLLLDMLFGSDDGDNISNRVSFEKIAVLELKVAYMLCHYPMNSEFFAPWNICGHFLVSSTSDVVPISATVDILLNILSQFAFDFQIPEGDVCTFIGSMVTGYNGCKLPNFDKFIHNNQFMVEFTKDWVLETLKENSGLLLWEYFRCYMRNRHESKVFDMTIFPFPTLELYHAAPSEIMPGAKAAIMWAFEVSGLNKEDAIKCLMKTLNPVGNPIFGKLTFSHFVLYAVRCFTFNSKDQVSFVKGLRIMLEKFSESISSLQKVVQMRLLKALCLIDNSSGVDIINLDRNEKITLIAASIAIYERRYNFSDHKEKSSVMIASSSSSSQKGKTRSNEWNDMKRRRNSMK